MATPQPNTAPHLQCQKQAAEAPLQSPEQRWQLSVCHRTPPGEIGFSVSTPVVTSMTSRGSDFQKPEWQWHLLGQQGSEESFSSGSHTSHTHTRASASSARCADWARNKQAGVSMKQQHLHKASVSSSHVGNLCAQSARAFCGTR